MGLPVCVCKFKGMLITLQCRRNSLCETKFYLLKKRCGTIYFHNYFMKYVILRCGPFIMTVRQIPLTVFATSLNTSFALTHAYCEYYALELSLSISWNNLVSHFNQKHNIINTLELAHIRTRIQTRSSKYRLKFCQTAT